MRSITVALVNLDIVWEAPEANFRALDSVLAAINSNHEVDLVVLPETFTTGFSPKATALADKGAVAEWALAWAKKMNAVIMGSAFTEVEGKIYNRVHCVGPEGYVCKTDKAHLFALNGEKETITPGKTRNTFKIKELTIAPMVCYDLRFPVWARNELLRKETEADAFAYDVLIYVANWPASRDAHWRNLLTARAIENQAYVVGVNRRGVDGLNVPHSGYSAVWDYKGDVLASTLDERAYIIATIDPEGLYSYRENFPFWRDADAFSFV